MSNLLWETKLVILTCIFLLGAAIVLYEPLPKAEINTLSSSEIDAIIEDAARSIEAQQEARKRGDL